MATYIEPIWIAAKTSGILINPRDPATDLICHHTEIAVRRFNGDKVENNVVCASIHKQFCRERIVFCLAA